jgi:hypothetical protein
LSLAAACSDRSTKTPPASTANPDVSFQTDSSRPHFGAVMVAPLDARGLAVLERTHLTAEEWQRILTVRVADSTSLPMLGEYVVAHDTLRFEPSFPPVRGTVYTARYDGNAFNAKTGASARPGASIVTWTRPRPSGASTTSVNEVYPTTDSVPMNLLRMYVQFSSPMTVGDGAEKHVRLLDERGSVVDKAFLIAAGGQELWDGDHTRMTIFFDPGRIKRDLTPHDALGLPLRDGHSYTLVIDSTIHDAHGLPLTRGFVKRFRVGPMDRTLPRASAWKVVAPAAGTRDPLTIELPEPLDHALLARMLTVKRVAPSLGSAVAGRVVTSDNDRRWSFTPTEPWVAFAYVVEIDSELEDLAGNNMKHLFDVMPGDSAARGVNGSVVRIAFTPKLPRAD